MPAVIIGAILLVISAFVGNGIAQKDKFLPTPTPPPFIFPTPLPTTKPVSKSSSSSNQAKTQNQTLIDCIGPDNKEFKATKEDCQKLNQAWGKTTDEMVNCQINASCGGGTKRMKKSECDNSICCLIDQKCGGPRLMSKSDCNKFYCPSSNSYNTGTSTSNYPPCVVYYPVLGYSQTYSYISPETCKTWQDNAKAGSKTTVPTIAPAPTFQPIPTSPSYRDYNDPLCQSIRSEWEQVKATIGPLDSSNQNYSSSADMMKDYLYWKDLYNSKYKSNLCSGYLN